MQTVVEELERKAGGTGLKNWKKIYKSLDEIINCDSSLIPAESYISEIKDPSGDVSNFNYDDAGKLISVTDPAGAADGKAKTEFLYDDKGNLIRISHTDGRMSSYKYDDRNRLTEAADETGRAIKYEYAENGEAVRKAEECVYVEFGAKTKGSNTDSSILPWMNDGTGREKKVKKPVAGQAFLIEVTDSNETVFTFSGKNDRLDSDRKKSKKKKTVNKRRRKNITLSDEGKSDDIKNVYCFDNNGRTLSITSRLAGTNKVIGAGSYSYVDKEDKSEDEKESNENTANKLSEAAQSGKAAINLLRNSGFEDDSDAWSKCGDSDSKAVIKLHEDPGKLYRRTGKYAASIYLNIFEKRDNAVYISQTADGLKSGNIYTASVYVKTTDIRNASAALKVFSNGREVVEYEPEGSDNWDEGDGEEDDEDDDESGDDDYDGYDAENPGDDSILSNEDGSNIVEGGNVRTNTP